MKPVLKFLRHPFQILYCRKSQGQKMELLTNEQQESYENVKICYICKGKFKHKYAKNKKNIAKLEIIVIAGECRGTEHSICNLKYTISKKITIIFVMYLTMFIMLS